METKDVLKKIREDNNLTQEEFAERVLVTRQAVSRWETGETQPNTETLKILSREFNVSINTLLGADFDGIKRTDVFGGVIYSPEDVVVRNHAFFISRDDVGQRHIIEHRGF